MLHQYIEIVPAMFQRWLHLQKQQANSDDALALCQRTHFKNARQRFGHIAEVAPKKLVYAKRKERMGNA